MKKILIILLLAPLLSMAQKSTIRGKVKFLALGDSYTIGESVPVKDRWPVQLIDALAKKGLDCFDPKIIATTGWRTDNLKSAIVNANLSKDYTLVSLLIGVNNFYQGRSIQSYEPEFKELLTMAITLAGGDKTKVFVVSIPDYGYTPFGKSYQSTISQGIDNFNTVNRAVTESMGVTYINITDISRKGLDDPSLVAGDGLHPSGKMYTLWVERILGSFNVDLTQIDDQPDDTDQGSVPPEEGPSTDPVTGIEDERQALHVYPNPFNTTLVVDSESSHENRLSIIDSKGVLVADVMFDTSASLDTSGFSTGLYHYQIISQSGSLLKGKIIKAY